MIDKNVSRFPGFDGLRAIAATLIVVHHAGFASGTTFRSDLGLFLGRMDIGVPIFFVISGFLLYRPFVAAQLGTRPAPDAREFWLKRVLRIFPEYWVALGVQLVFGAIVVNGAGGLFYTGTLLHPYHYTRAISGITQSWSLTTEIGFYVLLPFFAAWTAKRVARPDRTINQRAGRLLACCAVIYGASLVWRASLHVLDPSWLRITPQWFPSMADLFALGMALAVVSAWAEHRPLVRELAVAAGRRTAAWWLVALGVFWLVSTQFDLAVGLERTSFERETIRQGLYGVVGLAVVAPVALNRSNSDRLRRVLDGRVLTTLGVLSYGIYLWHQAFLKWIGDAAGWELFEGHFVELLVSAYACSVAAAWLSYRFIELPVARLRPGRGRTTRAQELVAP